jgi:RNA 2',3'-cyclic 3'-phosphodiesterase
MRCFVSVPVPEEAREHLDEYLETRRMADSSLRWSDPDRWHVTLAFMPDVAEVNLDELGERLEAACARRSPFTMGIRGGGVFGDVFAARVLWAGPRWSSAPNSFPRSDHGSRPRRDR